MPRFRLLLGQCGVLTSVGVEDDLSVGVPVVPVLGPVIGHHLSQEVDVPG